jgi:ribosomal protein S27E
MKNLRPGTWYLMYVCESCKTKQILFSDLSEGRAKINTIYRVRCPGCGHEASYDTKQIERYQHPETGTPPTTE